MDRHNYHGVYAVSCRQLGCPATKEASRDAANAWREATKFDLDSATPTRSRTNESIKSTLASTVVKPSGAVAYPPFLCCPSPFRKSNNSVGRRKSGNEFRWARSKKRRRKNCVRGRDSRVRPLLRPAVAAEAERLFADEMATATECGSPRIVTVLPRSATGHLLQLFGIASPLHLNL